MHNVRYILIQIPIIKKEMFEQKHTYNNPSTMILGQDTAVQNTQQNTISTLKDSIISLEFRLKTIEQQINTKIQRNECLTLLDRKATNAQLKKSIEQIQNRIENDKIKEQKNFQTFEQEQKSKLNKLKVKLTQVNLSKTNNNSSIGFRANQFIKTANNGMSHDSYSQHIASKIDKALVKPQELYLQSNQTMFSMLIDEIKQLKDRDSSIEKLIESKHKKTISLNNQVCRKLEFLERQIEETIHYIDGINSGSNWETLNNNTTVAGKKNNSKQQHQNKNNMQNSSAQNQAFQTIRLQMLGKTIENIQKQLSTKIHIKDVMPLIKQNTSVFQQALNQLKSNIEENFDSTRKILSNQSEINQQISKATRVGWWKCSGFSHKNYLQIENEIMNIIPQTLIWNQKQPCSVRIGQNGWFLIKTFHCSEDQQEDSQNQIFLMINGSRHYLGSEKMVNLSAGSELEFVSSEASEIFIQIQKL